MRAADPNPHNAYILSDIGQQQQTTPDDASFGLLKFSTLVKPKSQLQIVRYTRQTMKYPLKKMLFIYLICT